MLLRVPPVVVAMIVIWIVIVTVNLAAVVGIGPSRGTVPPEEATATEAEVKVLLPNVEVVGRTAVRLPNEGVEVGLGRRGVDPPPLLRRIRVPPPRDVVGVVIAGTGTAAGGTLAGTTRRGGDVTTTIRSGMVRSAASGPIREAAPRRAGGDGKGIFSNWVLRNASTANIASRSYGARGARKGKDLVRIMIFMRNQGGKRICVLRCCNTQNKNESIHKTIINI